jgi:uncharacterized protein with von Willebrand factor type A (vWA) domain
VDARIVEFAEVLRQNGLRVSTSEVVDAERAATLVDLSDLDGFRAALSATLCKRELDRESFQRCFTWFFSGAARSFEDVDRALARRLEEDGLLEGDELTMILYQLKQLLPGMHPLTQAVLEGDRAKLAALFRGAALQLDLSKMEGAFQAGFFGRRLLASAGADKAWADLKALESELKSRGLRPEGVEVVSRHVAGALRKVEEAARQEIGRQAQARTRRSAGTLSEKPLQRLGRDELERTQAAVRRLAEKLKTRLIRRQRRKARGALSPRRTLRKNLPWGGIPMVPVFRGKRPERPDVVILCDVSDSVRNVSRVMLLFTHTLQSLFNRVRSFVFVSDVGEATAAFRDASPEEAVETAVQGAGISLAANSNYGHALATFAREHLGAVTRRTTVLVIGDGRNNFNPAHAWALKEIKQRARRVVWICTEPRTLWGSGDSEMPSYARLVDQVVVVQTLEDLGQVAEQLVPVH